jgi:hypothetical protein
VIAYVYLSQITLDKKSLAFLKKRLRRDAYVVTRDFVAFSNPDINLNDADGPANSALYLV